MRLRRCRLGTYHHRAAISKKDSEGSTYTEYGPAVSFQAEEWPAGGKVQAEMYGQRLPNIRNLRIKGTYQEVPGTGKVGYAINSGPIITANDGICLCVDGGAEPDYKVVAIYPYRFLTLEVEKL